MLAVQASLVAAGSLAPDVLRHVARRPTVARRYLAVEGHRALAANEELLPAGVRGLTNHAVADGLATPAASLELARSRKPIADAPEAFGTIRVGRVLALSDRSEANRPAPTSGAAALELNRLSELTELAEEDVDGDDLSQTLSSPVGGSGAIGRQLRKLLHPAKAGQTGGPPGTDAPTHISARSHGLGSRSVASGYPPKAVEGVRNIRQAGTAYPEWDVHRRTYRPDWCVVIEGNPPAKGAVVATLPDHRALRRSLASIGRGFKSYRRQRQGDDIDIDAAVEARVDVLSGSPPGDGLYVENLRRHRDLAVLVLLDVSGSAGEPGTAGKTVHQHQRDLAGGLTAALHELGGRVALYAFNSRGRRAVQFWRVKTFEDRLDAQVALRLSRLAPAAYTRLGTAIRHGTKVLDQQAGTPKRLLVVISDGFAYDHGYEGRYAQADARRALVEARRLGVGCACLTVGAGGDSSALERVFGSAAHALVPNSERIPRMIGPLFRAALRSADVQRRTFQREERTRDRYELERRAGDSTRTTVLHRSR
jgi:hypothetical protein